MRPLLGTFVEIGINSYHNPTNSEEAINAAFSAIQIIHNLLSFHKPSSELSLLNQSHGVAVKAHGHTLRVLCLAKGLMRASNGLFNCTVGGMMIAHGVLPNHGGDASASGHADDIEIHHGKVALKNNVKITLDGIAKGYAVDCAIAALKRNGIISAWVNAGGDLRVYGDMVLPVQRREIDGSFSALGSLQNSALASSQVSAVYDKDFPAKIVSDCNTPELGVWSVMSHYAWRADALTKVASLASAHERIEIIEKLGGKIVYPIELVSA